MSARLPATPVALHPVLQRPAVWAALLTAAAWLVVLSSAPAPVRVPVVFAFCLSAPGLALVAPLRLRAPLMEAMLAVATSVAVLILVSYGMLKWGSWSTTPLLVSLTIPAVLGVLLETLTVRSRVAREEER